MSLAARGGPSVTISKLWRGGREDQHTYNRNNRRKCCLLVQMLFYQTSVNLDILLHLVHTGKTGKYDFPCALFHNDSPDLSQ